MFQISEKIKISYASLVKVRWGRRELDIVPFYSIWYFIISLILLGGTGLILEKVIYPSMEADAMFPTPAWEKETALINKAHSTAIRTEDKVYRTLGFPVAEAPKKGHRILVMGDSFAWGAALVNMNDIWWRQLQRELNHRGYQDVEVISACSSGASTHMELDWARQIVSKYHPDLVIWGYVTNDPDESLVKRLGPVSVGNPSANSVLKNLFPLMSYRLLDLCSIKETLKQSCDANGYAYQLWELKLLEGSNYKAYQKTVNELAAFHRQTGIPGFVMTLPNHPSPDYFPPRYAKVKPLFDEVGMPFYDIFPDFYKAYHGKPLLFFAATPNDIHPGPVVTHFFAVQAANILEHDYPKVLGLKSPVPPPRIHINSWIPSEFLPQETAEGTLVFRYPVSTVNMLQMPIQKPYFQFNLEEPAVVREFHLSGKHLVSATLYITVIDPELGYDSRKMICLGEQKGKDLVWDIKRLFLNPKVNTIRLLATFESIKENIPVIPIDSSSIKHENKYCWTIQLPESARLTDDEINTNKSTLVLLEDGFPFGIPYSHYDKIREGGGGLYSHWKDKLYFSTSNNTNPTTNGRSYSMMFVGDFQELTLQILPETLKGGSR